MATGDLLWLPGPPGSGTPRDAGGGTARQDERDARRVSGTERGGGGDRRLSQRAGFRGSGRGDMPMTRKTSLDGLESAPQWILMFLGAYVTVNLFVLYLWNAAGQMLSIQGTSDGSSALSVTGMTAVEVWLCLAVLRSFPAGAPLRSTWMLLTLAAAARAASGVLTEFLGTNWLLNPLVWSERANSGLIGQIRQAALAGVGP